MDCVLVRHAIAADRDPEKWPDDRRRPLTARGVERFRAAARGLARIVPDVELVLASPYARAWATAEILHAEAGWPAPEPCAELEAEQPPHAAVEVLRARSVASIALVGHEPYLSSLASLLLTGDESALRLVLKKGGALMLGIEGEHAALRWHATPLLLRAVRP